MSDDQSFTGRCPTCGQTYMGAHVAPPVPCDEACPYGGTGPECVPAPARPWGYYWVTTEEDDDGDEATLAEWCCSDARRNEGHWWFCGSGAYDDSPRVKAVLMGPLAPPRDLTLPPTGRIIPE